MNEIFMIFLSLSLSGTLVTLFYFLFKPLFKDRLSKSWQYYILLVVILRFLIPFSPETSLVGIMLNQTERSDAISGPVFNMHETDYVPNESLFQIQIMPKSNTNNPELLGNAGQIGMKLLWFGWLTPIVIMMLRKIIAYRRSVRSIKAGCIKIDNTHVLDIYREVSREIKIKHSPELTQNESVAAPMLVGIFYPVIILPDLCLKDNELRYVLQHELTHYKRLDILYKWLTQITVCLHWFNPLVYWVCQEINRNCELSCDEAIIKRLDESEKYAYGDMLIETIKLNKKSSIPVLSITLNEDAKLIKERLSAIMQFRKMSKIYTAVSLVLAVIFLCGAIYTGAYAQSKGALTNLISNSNHNTVREIPDKIKFGGNSNAKNLSFGEYMLDTDSNYSLTVSWKGGSDTLKLSLVGVDDYHKEYTLSNGKAVNIGVPKNGIYYFRSLGNHEIGNMRSLSAEFHLLDVIPSTSAKVSDNIQTVVYENVGMRHYEKDSNNSSVHLAHPYVHHVKSNNTNKTIIGYQCGMLAFDKDGNPLEIAWNSLNFPLNYSFYYQFSVDWDLDIKELQILPGETFDIHGGWSLNVNGNDPTVYEIAYVLYCDKEITFEDGTVWKNPDFDNWRNTYEGKKKDAEIIENYYPYVQKIGF